MRNDMAKKPEQIVQRGYDRIAAPFLDWTTKVRTEERAKYTRLVIDRVAPGSHVLDLGCGAGLPTTRTLTRQYRVTGVDISASQLELAQRSVPEANLLQAEMSQLGFGQARFESVVAFYSIIHLPRHKHAGLLQNVASWLRPGGLFVAAMGWQAHDGFREDFFGELMYWSTFDGRSNAALVRDAGLEIIDARQETDLEFGKLVSFFWIVARKPAARATHQLQPDEETSPVTV